ncbi:hypothetical protein [Sinorhizobium meliloti]|jgi:hypothetical protein|uniref:hypothetical protein n=1 Tax=Rhizobium meliloti TaxID=382 RepID=UPI003F182BFC
MISLEEGMKGQPLYLKAAHAREGRPKIIFSRGAGLPDIEVTVLDDGALALREYRREEIVVSAVLADQ